MNEKEQVDRRLYNLVMTLKQHFFLKNAPRGEEYWKELAEWILQNFEHKDEIKTFRTCEEFIEHYFPTTWKNRGKGCPFCGEEKKKQSYLDVDDIYSPDEEVKR